MITRALEGLVYYHTYDRFFLGCSVVLGFVGWTSYVVLLILKTHASLRRPPGLTNMVRTPTIKLNTMYLASSMQFIFLICVCACGGVCVCVCGCVDSEPEPNEAVCVRRRGDFSVPGDPEESPHILRLLSAAGPRLVLSPQRVSHKHAHKHTFTYKPYEVCITQTHTNTFSMPVLKRSKQQSRLCPVSLSA